jgi:hypothetical protein
VGTRGALLALMVIVAIAVLGCSDDSEPSPEAVAEAEELALAALLTEGDLPGIGWEVSEVGWPAEDAGGNDEVRLVPQEEATPAAWAEVCGMPEQATDGWETAEGQLVMRARNFIAFESLQGGGLLGLLVSVVVFESSDDAEAALDRRAASLAIPGLSDERCREAIAAEIGVDSFDFRQEELTDGLDDSIALLQTSVYTKSDETNRSVTETHLFVRGRVMGSYVILGGDESPREIDHGKLLAVFESRVVAVQE